MPGEAAYHHTASLCLKQHLWFILTENQSVFVDCADCPEHLLLKEPMVSPTFFFFPSSLLFCNFCSHREGHRRGMSVASITKAKHQRKYLLSQALTWEYDMPSLIGVSVGPGGLCVLAGGLSQVGDWRSCTEPYVKGTSFPPVLLLCLGLSCSFFPSFSCFSPRSTRSQPLSPIHFVSFPYSLSISFLHP